MKKVTIITSSNTVSSTFTGPLDVFSQVGIHWNRLFGLQEQPQYETEIVNPDGRQFHCSNGLLVTPNRSLHDVSKSDIIIISSLGRVEDALEEHRNTPSWLKQHFNEGAVIASVCTGAFLLAETGLLDGKMATTHWGYAESFQQWYPNVDLQPDRIITDESPLLCSAGFLAGIDLSLFLVGKFHGVTTALQCAKIMLHDLNRPAQTHYSTFQARKCHRDSAILEVQNVMENNYASVCNVQNLAREHGMSLRTLERRFKAATGLTPVQYVQHIRIEITKRMLEETDHSFEEITFKVGYEDSAFLRKIFLRDTGLTPVEYRKRFKVFYS